MTPAAASSRALCFDVTHLVARMLIRAPSGIDKIDLAYGRHMAAHHRGPLVHYGLTAPHTLRVRHLDDVLSRMGRRTWTRADAGGDPTFERVRRWIVDGVSASGSTRTYGSRRRDLSRAALADHTAQLRLRLTVDGGPVPHGAVYLNVAQVLLEHPRFLRWLGARPDVTGVFVIHDLLPLDFPEYWPKGASAVFARRIDTALTYGRAFITSSTSVRDRLAAERMRRGLGPAPIHVGAFPSSLGDAPVDLYDEALSRAPYFVIVGTIEPRKNHLMLFNIWRRMAERGGPVPKLVVIGARGWENEQALDVLDRGALTKPHILEASGLSTDSLKRLIGNARALLMPSFAEGYGLPVVEALSLGTPVIASDLPVFREVAQGLATFVPPLDGLGWLREVERLAALDQQSPERSATQRFRAPNWSGYFSGVDAFLAGL